MDWDEYGLGFALWAAKKSKDPSTKVGAAIMRPDHTIVSAGYNGFPRGVEDSHERLHNRELKYKLVVHAEVNAILHAREPLRGYTMYTTLPPCSGCAGSIVQSQISRVVSYAPSAEQMTRWNDSLQLALKVFEEAGVEATWIP